MKIAYMVQPQGAFPVYFIYCTNDDYTKTCSQLKPQTYTCRHCYNNGWYTKGLGEMVTRNFAQLCCAPLLISNNTESIHKNEMKAYFFVMSSLVTANTGLGTIYSFISSP